MHFKGLQFYNKYKRCLLSFCFNEFVFIVDQSCTIEMLKVKQFQRLLRFLSS